jgi:hypothetical protein
MNTQHGRKTVVIIDNLNIKSRAIDKTLKLSTQINLKTQQKILHNLIKDLEIEIFRR